MRRVSVLFLTAPLLALASSSAVGQGPARPSMPIPAQTASPVALVDIVKVFENHRGFRQQMEAIRAEIQAFEREMQQQQESLTRQSQQLSTASDAQKPQLEGNLARQAADMQVKASLKRNEILDREAKIYFETYNEVSNEVARIANTYNISLVLRYDSAAMNPQDRGSVLKGVNRPVVVQRNLDLTEEVIRRFGGPVPTDGVSLGSNTRPQERSLGNRVPFSGGYPN